MWLYDTPANPTIINALWIIDKVLKHIAFIARNVLIACLAIPIMVRL